MNKRASLIVLPILFTVALSGIVGPALAGQIYPPPIGNVYEGYEETKDTIGQVFKVWVTVDTRYDTIKVKYEGHLLSVQYGFIGGFCGAFVLATDDKGYVSEEIRLGGYYGEQTFYQYRNTYTWVHARVSWLYIGAFWAFTIECKANVYVGV